MGEINKIEKAMKEPSETLRISSEQLTPSERAATQGVAFLAEAYGVEITKARSEIYIRSLASELSQAEIELACSEIIKECKFFPSIAELFSMVENQDQVSRFRRRSYDQARRRDEQEEAIKEV